MLFILTLELFTGKVIRCLEAQSDSTVIKQVFNHSKKNKLLSSVSVKQNFDEIIITTFISGYNNLNNLMVTSILC